MSSRLGVSRRRHRLLFRPVASDGAGGVVDTRGGSEIRTTVDPSGIESRTTRGPDDMTVSLAGDGTRTTTTLGPDPRFGMMAPAARFVEVRTPNNVQMNVQEIRDVQYSDSEDPARATLISTLTRINGSDDYFDEWDDYERTRVSRTPMGRTTTASVDTLGHVTRLEVPGLSPVNYTYDARGRLASSTQGGRVWQYGYDAAGRLASVSDPRGTRVFGYDPGTGHLSSLTSPDEVTLGHTYDGALPLSESWSGAVNESVSLTYDNRFRPITQTVNGNTMTLGYDGDGLLIAAGAVLTPATHP